MKSIAAHVAARTLCLIPLTFIGCGGDSDPSGVPAEDASTNGDAHAPDAADPNVLPDGPVVIAEGQGGPSGIAVNDDGVFFANRTAGTIVRCPHAGCGAEGPTVLASDQDAPISVAINETHLYWVTGRETGQTGAPFARVVFRCDPSDCSATIEAFDRGDYEPYDVEVSSDAVYIAAWPQFGQCPMSGCSDGSVKFGDAPAVSIDVDADYSYVALYGWGEVSRCPIAGCGGTPSALLSEITPIGVAVDDENFYAIDNDALSRVAGAPDTTPNRILRCPLAGCGASGPVVVASGDISPYAVAEHGDRLYYTNIDHGSVVSVPKDSASDAGL